MARASGTDLARRSSLVPIRVSPSRAAARAWLGAGGTGEAVIGVDAIVGDTRLQDRLLLGGRILLGGGTARVSDQYRAVGRIRQPNECCYVVVQRLRPPI